MEPIRAALAICLERDLTFTAFRAGAGVQLWISIKPGLRKAPWSQLKELKNVFLVAPFITDEEHCTYLQPDLQFDLNSDQLEPFKFDQAEGALSDHLAPPNHWSEGSHAQAINAVQQKMRTGELEKVVLSRTKEIPLDRTIIPDLFTTALKEQPEAFICLLNCPEFGTWLGASPEMLVRANSDHVEVDSIAGTLPLKAAPSDPDQWGEKEREEQEMVTRSVLGTFTELGLKQIQIKGPKVLKALHVAHLHTKLKADLGTVELASLVKALHPTPAVCGTPREAALNAILQHEPHHRSLYAGFWGPWQHCGITALHVNIRCTQLLHDRAIIYVGGGITAGSVPAKEWAETEHKALIWQRPLEALRAGIT